MLHTPSPKYKQKQKKTNKQINNTNTSSMKKILPTKIFGLIVIKISTKKLVTFFFIKRSDNGSGRTS